MKQIVAIVNVIAWAGFWAFGYLAITAEGLTEGQIAVAAVLAFAGMATGIFAYMRLVRYTEASGYAKRSRKLDPEDRKRSQDQWSN